MSVMVCKASLCCTCLTVYICVLVPVTVGFSRKIRGGDVSARTRVEYGEMSSRDGFLLSACFKQEI